MIKLLIGGSPCTYWSIARKANREAEAKGLGWELFRNYLIAKEKFKPDFFLYENNKSAAQAIKDQISRELGVDLMYINSALVSAQNRQRFYAFNWTVEQPENRGIYLQDILEPSVSHYQKSYTLTKPVPVNTTDDGKSQTIKAQYAKNSAANFFGYTSTYGATGVAELITEPFDSIKDGTKKDPKRTIYEVKNGRIETSKTYPVNLPDGLYLIRKLTPVECERLQTLPDNYTAAVSNAQRYKGIGNSWTAEVIIHILNGALKDVPRNEEIIVLSMYDGIGTGLYCLKKMGFTNIKYYAYEIDEPAIKVALSNFPDIIQSGDAFDLRRNDWALGKSF